MKEFGLGVVSSLTIGTMLIIGLTEVISDYTMIYFDVAKFGDFRALLDYVPGDSSDNFLVPGIAGILPMLAGLYVIGKWLGARSRCSLLIATLGIFVITLLVKIWTMFILMKMDWFPKDINETLFFSVSCILGAVLFTAVTALGFWRGRRYRLPTYLCYLLGLLPDASRATLLSLAEDEVRTHQLSVRQGSLVTLNNSPQG